MTTGDDRPRAILIEGLRESQIREHRLLSQSYNDMHSKDRNSITTHDKELKVPSSKAPNETIMQTLGQVSNRPKDSRASQQE